MNELFFAWIHWNPPRELFTVPVIDRPIAIYGALFVLGFIISYFLLASIFKKILLQKSMEQAIKDMDPESLENSAPSAFATAKSKAYFLVDKLTWFVVLGTIIGARLGHILFYEWPRYQNNLMDIFKIWEGGLASHGGVLGVLIAALLYYHYVLKKTESFSLLTLFDCLVIPAGLVACFIRIGNFFNQEILGPPTQMPWGIIFEDPADGSLVVPRHPTQLYEAIAYLSIFFLIFALWRKKFPNLRPGFLSGLFLILLFSVRFLLEFIKSPQYSLMIDESYLQAGQYLSIPFILFGLFLLIFGKRFDQFMNDRQLKLKNKSNY